MASHLQSLPNIQVTEFQSSCAKEHGTQKSTCSLRRICGRTDGTILPWCTKLIHQGILPSEKLAAIDRLQALRDDATAPDATMRLETSSTPAAEMGVHLGRVTSGRFFSHSSRNARSGSRRLVSKRVCFAKKESFPRMMQQVIRFPSRT